MTQEQAVEIVKDEAQRAGVVWADAEAGFVLWNNTGWPAFFDGDAETCIREHVRSYIAGDE